MKRCFQPPERASRLVRRQRIRRSGGRQFAVTAASRYRAILAAMPDIVMEVDTNKVYTWANPAGLKFFGEDVLGKEASFYFVGQQDTYRIVQPLFDGDESIVYVESWQRRCDGQPRLLAWWCRVLKDDRGRVIGAISTARDITEQRRTEEEMRRRTAQQEALNAIIAAAVTATDLSELLATTLDHTLRVMGLAAGGLWMDGRFALRGLPADSIPAFTEALWTAGLATGVPIAVADWQDAASPPLPASLVTLMAHLGIRATLTVPVLAGEKPLGGLAVAAREPHPWPDAEVALAEAVGRQVGMAAERLRLLEQTREQAHRLQQIMDAISDGLLLLDAEGRVLQANPAGREYLALLAGVGEGEILTHLGPRPLAEVLSPPPPKLWHEVVVEGPPRRSFQVQARALGLASQSGGWVLDIREDTGERELAARYEQQSRLAAMGQFAAGIAHDFNNVLQGVLSFAELLAQRPELPAQAREQAQFICRMAERGAQMTRQILDFSRQSVSEKRPLEMGAFLREMAGLFRRTVSENIELLLECSPGEYPVHGDEAQLQQVLMNLVANARDAMPQGGHLTLRLASLTVGPEGHPHYSEVPAGEWVCLEVADTGCGIPAEALPHIFEPFFTTKERGRGTGLGLAQAYGIVQQHEGYIHVQSAVGQGTTVSVLLPARPQAIEMPSSAHPTAPGSARRTILLVEDDAAVRQALAATLADMGYNVLPAAGGPEALEAHSRRADEIALVLTDAVMPGLELPALLHSLGERAPVVVMSGYPPSALGLELPIPGVVEWLPKPVSRERLAQAIQRWVEGHSRAEFPLSTAVPPLGQLA